MGWFCFSFWDLLAIINLSTFNLVASRMEIAPVVNFRISMNSYCCFLPDNGVEDKSYIFNCSIQNKVCGLQSFAFLSFFVREDW